ncbi:MAG TPA: DUF5335 family protein [Chthonomonadaceae bacterium]|nr:DUF5335 family protein [Chthonomonadaceae bacterium]
METREVSKQDWVDFCDNFSKQHQGLAARVEVRGGEVGARPETGVLPFVGISADEKGSEPNSIIVMLGTETQDHIEHLIDHPRRLVLKSDGDRAHEALEIDAEDGTKTIVQMEPMAA